MAGTKIGAQLFTLRDYLKTPQDMASTLKKVRKMGYQAVQISALGPIEPKELRKILDNEGLCGCATHTGYEQLVGNIEAVIEEHKILGATHVACPGLPRELHNAKGYKKVARELSQAGKTLKDNGITLSYHNHDIELIKYAGKTGLDILYDESDPEYLQGEIDTYWIQHGGGDPVAWCRKLKNRLPLLHLKDMSMTPDGPVMAEVGEGNLNWEAILAACEDAGTQWYLVEQDVCQRHPLESLKISLENMKKMGLS